MGLSLRFDSNSYWEEDELSHDLDGFPVGKS